MRHILSVLLTTALLAGCQTRHAPPSSHLQSFNAGAEIAQPPDMALKTVQHWIIKSFPDTTQPIQAISPQTGEIRAQVQFDFPCMHEHDCLQKQGHKVNATLRIKIMPQRAAINLSHVYWQAGSTGPGEPISDPADKQQLQATLQGLANSLFTELAMP